MPDLVVTNFNRNFTGVSATAAGVVRQQIKQYDMMLAGYPLPGCPSPVSRATATRASKYRSKDKPFTIWHVRRNPEMRAAIWARDVLRLPIRIVFTSAAQRYHSSFPRWLISRMDAVIATTDKAAEFVPNVRAVIPHGVDTNQFFPAVDRAAAWTATGFPGQRGVATIGRIRPEKGTDRFVAAMLRLLPDHPDISALVIGRAAKSDSGFLNDLKARIDAVGLADRILFPGEVSPDNLPPLMRSLSAVVQLPRYEGYGMTPLEGMASGVPFVATEAGYYRSFSEQGKNGLIVPEDDVEAVSSELDSLLTDSTRFTVMSHAARAAAETQFSIRKEVDGIGNIYGQLWDKGVA